MAEGARTPRGKAPASEPQELLLDEPLATPPAAPSGFEALVTALGGGTLDFPAMLAIADILPVMVGYVDTSFVYRFVNKPFADWFERPRRDILGRHMSELIGGDSFASRAPMLEAALGGERVLFAAEYEHPNRGSLALQVDYVPWADAHGEVRGIIILATDVTEQRAYERALRESEERFRRIANSA